MREETDMDTLESVARALVPPGRGILAADESHPTIAKRFAALGIENLEENRRLYRQLLFTTGGLSDFISGVILFDETIRQKADDGTPFPGLLTQRGILPGIKVDKGTRPLSGAAGEVVSEGLDGLHDRLSEYKALGARFAKWRAVITIGPGILSAPCIRGECARARLPRGRVLGEAVRFGVAAGAAAVMNPGTALCRREDVERLYPQVMTLPG
jgi:fructose-bisphosphate aldolase, class I